MRSLQSGLTTSRAHRPANTKYPTLSNLKYRATVAQSRKKSHVLTLFFSRYGDKYLKYSLKEW